jgi:hypothetical protein
MAQKESAHREIVDDLTSQLAQVQRQHDDLSTLSRNQVGLVIKLLDYDSHHTTGIEYVL